MELVLFTFNSGNNQSCEIQVLDSHGNPWFYGKDIAMALEYKDTDQAVRIHVKEKHKKCLKDIPNFDPVEFTGYNNSGSHYLNKIFINESGLYSLIFGSKKEMAEIFKDWVTEEVLPTLRKTGKYAMPLEDKALLPSGEDQIFLQIRATIDSFSSYVSVEGLKDKNVVYIAYIGQYKIKDEWKHCFKYGRSSSADARTKTHKSTYNTFDLIYMKECMNNLSIENGIKNNVKKLGISTELKINDNNYTEIFYIDEWDQLQDIMKDVDCSVVLQHKDENETTIKLLTKENEIKKLEYSLLESNFSSYKQTIELEKLGNENKEYIREIIDLKKLVEQLQDEIIGLKKIVEEYKQQERIVNNITINQAPTISTQVNTSSNDRKRIDECPANILYEEYKELNKISNTIANYNTYKQCQKLMNAYPFLNTDDVKDLAKLKNLSKRNVI